MAMPPPMVPAPTTAASLDRDRRRVLGDVGNLGHLALAEEDVDQRLRLIGEQALLEQFGFARQAFVERQPGGGFHRIDGRLRSHQLRCVLRAASRGRCETAGSQLVPSFRADRALRRGRCPTFDLRERDGACQQIACHDLVDDAVLKRVRGADRIAAARTSRPLSRPRPTAAGAAFRPRRE